MEGTSATAPFDLETELSHLLDPAVQAEVKCNYEAVREWLRERGLLNPTNIDKDRDGDDDLGEGGGSGLRERLPTEVWCEVIGCLDFKSLFSLTCVDYRFNALAWLQLGHCNLQNVWPVPKWWRDRILRKKRVEREEAERRKAREEEEEKAAKEKVEGKVEEGERKGEKGKEREDDAREKKVESEEGEKHEASSAAVPPAGAAPTSSSSSSSLSPKSPWYADDLSKLYDSAPDALSYVLGFLSVRCPNLRSLSLPSHVEARHASYMPTSIRELSLHYVLQSANFNALLPAIDERLPGLTTLRIIRSAIKADSIPLIPRGVVSLSLEGSPRLEMVKDLPPGLKRLSLRSCNVLTADAFHSLPEGLEFLDVAYCRLLADAALNSLPKRLRALVLIHNAHITDAGLRNLPPGLTEIKIKQCVGVSTNGIIGLPLRLRSLSLNGHFDRDLLLSLPFEELHHLTLSNISSVDDETLSAFLSSRAAQSLRSLSLRYCPVSDAGLAVLPSSLLSLTIFGASTGGVWNASHAKQTGVITEKTFRSLPSTVRHVRIKALPYVSSGTVQNLRQAGITVREG